VVGADDEVGGDGLAVGGGFEVGLVALDPGQGALASRSRLTLLTPPSRAMNRFRLTRGEPADQIEVTRLTLAQPSCRLPQGPDPDRLWRRDARVPALADRTVTAPALLGRHNDHRGLADRRPEVANLEKARPPTRIS